MQSIFLKLAQLLAEGNNAMLAMVVASKGSSPGVPGALMLVTQKGRQQGTIGGGALEFQAEQMAMDALKERQGRSHEFVLHPGSAADIGMVCGGDVTVQFYYFPAGSASASFATMVATAYDKDENTWLLTDLGENGGIALCTAKEAPHPLILEKAPRLPLPATLPEGLFRPLAVEQEVDGRPLFCQPLTRAGRCVVFGGGHVSQALMPVLAGLDFKTVLFEDRPEFARPELFPPQTHTILGDYSNISASLPLSPSDWIIVVTRGHSADFEVLRQVLKNTYTYVGVIGSRAKTISVNARLREAGITDEVLATVHTPIGLPIGAVTPAEIAISIAGELIQLRAKLNG